VLGGLLLGAAFVMSGIYNVAASARHFDITNAVIRLTLRRSVATHSIGIEAPANLADERLARLGARHFALGCAPCHASPASPQNPVVAEMYPAPPPLSEAAGEWETEELFWIVMHGLKFTGMPAWPAQNRDEEVWALVAFLERLPEMEAEEYAELADAAVLGGGGARFDFGRAGAEDITAMCGTCHGDADTSPVHPLAPHLGGQKPDYLRRALAEYAENRRPSGIMAPIATELGPDAIGQLARHYAGQPAPAPARKSGDAEMIRMGGEIAQRGLREDDIPACVSCHAGDRSGEFPRLEGLSAEYISTQLRLFSEGTRAGSTYAAIMAPIARRLSAEQIEAVAAYFSSVPAQEAAGQ